MRPNTFNLTARNLVRGSIVPVDQLSPINKSALIDNTIIHNSYRELQHCGGQSSKVKKFKAKSSKATQNPIDWERARIKAYLSPISHASLRDSLVVALQARGEKVLIIAP